MYPHKSGLTNNAQTLRRNMTPEEKHLWYDFLKKLPITVKRQYNIENYILDFFIPNAKLAIELDGAQHYEPEARLADKIRDDRLSLYGIRVLRYKNADIKSNFEGVASDILKNLNMDFTDLNFQK